jgi:hypothetical protein
MIRCLRSPHWPQMQWSRTDCRRVPYPNSTTKAYAEALFLICQRFPTCPKGLGVLTRPASKHTSILVPSQTKCINPFNVLSALEKATNFSRAQSTDGELQVGSKGCLTDNYQHCLQPTISCRGVTFLHKTHLLGISLTTPVSSPQKIPNTAKMSG